METLKSRLVTAALIASMVFILQAFLPAAVRAQRSPEATQIKVNAPAKMNVGERVSLQAVVVDSHGKPVSNQTVYFSTRASFLNKSSDVVLSQAQTNKDGQAEAQWVDTFSGPVTLKAEFRGNEQYAPSSATAEINSAGSGQVYAEHIGVDIPGFNVPPAGAPVASLQSPAQGSPFSLARLWPTMTGWPVAAALIIVWALYFRAVTLIFHITSPNDEPGNPASASSRRSS